MPAFTQQERDAWRATCTKLGLSDGMTIPHNPGGTKSEVLQARNTVRRAATKILDEVKRYPDSDELMNAAEFAAKYIEASNAMLDAVERAGGGLNAERGDNILRNAADIRAHYEKRGAPAAGFGIHDLMKGVAGLRVPDSVRASLSEGVTTEGGFAVPDIVQGPILAALAEQSALMRAGVGIKPLNVGAKSMTYPAIDTIPTAAWRLENGNVVESDATFRGVTIVPHSLAFMLKVSRELLADGEGLEVALQVAFAQSMAKALDNAGLLGNGTAPNPRGLVNVAGVNTVSLGTDGALLADYGPFMSATGKLLEQSVTPNAAILSIRDRMTLAGLKDTTGQPMGVPPFLADLSLVPSAQLPTNLVVGASGAKCAQAIVGDFSTVHWVMREQMSIQLARELYAGTGQVGFIVHVRADLAVTYPKALCLINGIKGA